MPKTLPQGLFELVGSLYEIAQDGSHEAWSGAYAKLARLLNCGPGSIIVLPAGAETFELLCHNIPPKALKEYNEYYHQVNPFRELLFAIKPGESFTRRDKVPDQDFIRTEFYRDFLKKYDVFNYRYELLFRNARAAAGIVFTKPRSRPEFTAAELDTLCLVAPHITRAFELNLTLTWAGARSDTIEAAMDLVPRNVILVDLAGRVEYANAGARALLDAKDGVRIAADRTLQVDSGTEHRAFRGLVRSAIGPLTVEKAKCGGPLQISRPSGRRSYGVLVTAFSGGGGSSDGQRFASVFISDPEETAETAREVLIDMYDLTPAEARIAEMLTDGRSLDQICDRLTITSNTVKTHLKHIFSKTGTSRQSELIKLILKGPATIRCPNGAT